jgi:hypothetical protein
VIDANGQSTVKLQSCSGENLQRECVRCYERARERYMEEARCRVAGHVGQTAAVSAGRAKCRAQEIAENFSPQGHPIPSHFIPRASLDQRKPAHLALTRAAIFLFACLSPWFARRVRFCPVTSRCPGPHGIAQTSPHIRQSTNPRLSGCQLRV